MARYFLAAILAGLAALSVRVPPPAVRAGELSGGSINDGDVTTAKIAAGAVTTPKIARDAVTAVAILTGSVTTTKLDAGSVTTSKIGDNAVGSNALLDGAVTTSRLAAAAVTTSKLDAGAVTTEKIANDAVTPSKVAQEGAYLFRVHGGSLTVQGAAGARFEGPVHVASAALNLSGAGAYLQPAMGVNRELTLVASTMTVLGDSMGVNPSGATTGTGFTVGAAAAQSIAAGGTISANMCGGFKNVTSAGNVTTDTANTFSSPSAANSGCIMHVCNSGSFTITLDVNGNFLAAGAADQALGPNDCIVVGSNGTNWYQMAAVSAN